jgi:hypothetical protein
MTIALLSLSWLCFACCGFYFLLSFRAALGASRRHGGGSVFLEFRPWSTRGGKERSRVLKRAFRQP